MIRTSSPQPSGAKATVINTGRGAIFSGAFQGFKHVSKAFGFYQDIKPYLPETYVDRYRYKPHKRVTGYLGQTFHAKKRSRTSKKYNQKQFYCKWRNDHYTSKYNIGRCR